MTHKMFDVGTVGCIKAGESQCCTFDDCPLFKQCFPDAYKSWQKKVKREKRESVKV